MTKQYGSLLEMLSDSEHPEVQSFKGRLEEKFPKYSLSRALSILRNQNGLTQEQLAEKMGVSTDIVESIEHCEDEQFYLRDLKMYISAMGYRVRVDIHSGNTVALVKHHALEISKLLKKLAEVCKGDLEMEKGLASFLDEALVNLIHIVDDAGSALGKEVQIPGEVLEVFSGIPENESYLMGNYPATSAPQPLSAGAATHPERKPKMAKSNQHVTPREDGKWAVKSAGAVRASSVHDTQRDAIKVARDRAREQGTELLIHGRDGQIRARDSYGGDPYPPKG